MTGGEGGGNGSGRDEQLRMWESASARHPLGVLEDEDGDWELHLMIERGEGGLCRGRIAFRHGERHLMTAPVIVEEDEAAVLQRARELPESMIRQFFLSVRDG